MFHMTWNGRISGTELTWVARSVAAALPTRWRAEIARGNMLRIAPPDGPTGSLPLVVRSTLDPKDVSGVRRPALVAARFLSPRTRELLSAIDVSYVDRAGNLRLQLDRPAVFVQAAPVDKNPWKERRETQLLSLRGPAAGRVTRAITDFVPPYGVRELAQRAQAPASSVSRVVSLLDREALALRGTKGEIVSADWTGLIRRWVKDYSMLSSNETRAYLEPRGLDELLRKLSRWSEAYAISGSLAASKKAPVAPPRLAVVYVREIELAASELELLPAETGANIILARPFDPVAFDRTWTQDGLRFAALSQVAADLLTSPGRGPAEAEALLQWMKEHDEWRGTARER
jgi:hypothetical protein